MNELNLNRIRKFIAALRSGEYTRGTGALTYEAADGSYRDCCLGVACKVAIADGLELPTGKFSGTHTVFYGTRKEVAILPPEVRDFFGFESSNPALRLADDTMVFATTLNDSFGFSFAKIADAFERTYLPEDYYAQHTENQESVTGQNQDNEGQDSANPDS